MDVELLELLRACGLQHKATALLEMGLVNRQMLSFCDQRDLVPQPLTKLHTHHHSMHCVC